MVTDRAGAAHPSQSNTDQRSEEHTSELQSQSNLVCRLLLEKKKKHVHKDAFTPSLLTLKRHVAVTRHLIRIDCDEPTPRMSLSVAIPLVLGPRHHAVCCRLM